MLSKENTKITENISINEPKFNEKNTTKFNKLIPISTKEQLTP